MVGNCPTSPSSPPAEPVGLMDLLNKAIAEGNHKEAAQLAKEVSKSQISAKVTNPRAKSNSKTETKKIRS